MVKDINEIIKILKEYKHPIPKREIVIYTTLSKLKETEEFVNKLNKLNKL
jgi:hypothetical protein